MLDAPLLEKSRARDSAAACTSRPWCSRSACRWRRRRRRRAREIAGLHVHIERAVALGIGQARDAVHLRGEESEVLVEVGLIDEDLVDAQLLEGERVVLALAVGALLELGDEALLGFSSSLTMRRLSPFLGLGFEDRVFELLNLLPTKRSKVSSGDGKNSNELCETMTAS
jgi:hypothetical protein